MKTLLTNPWIHSSQVIPESIAGDVVGKILADIPEIRDGVSEEVLETITEKYNEQRLVTE